MSDRFRDALTGAWNKIEERQWLYGHLGKMNVDESYTLAVPGRKNFVYVTIRNSNGAQTAVPARNDAAVALEGRIPVKLKLEKGVYVIYGRSGRTDLGSPLIPPVNPHTHPVAEVNLNILGIPTYTTLEGYVNTTGSKGRVSGGAISDAGGATVNVAAGTGYFRATNSEVAEILSFNWPAVTGLSIPAGSVRYIKVEYNAGTPQVALDTIEDLDEETEFLLGSVVNEAGTLHITSYPESLPGTAHHVSHALREVFSIRRAERIGGIILGETGTRNLTITTGELYLGFNEFTFPAFDTSGIDTFDLYYRDGVGGFTKVAAQTAWPNTQWDNGSGTLADLTAARYGVVWVYVELDGDVVALYGRGNHVGAANAESEDPPTSIPLRLQNHGVLIGRIIFQKSGATATEIQSAWTKVFNPAQAADHGELSGLDGNDHPQYSLVGHVHALDDLSDVNLAGLADGQGITYDLASNTWKPASIALGDYVDRDGSRPLTGDWNAGAFKIGVNITPIRPIHIDLGAATNEGFRLGRTGAANSPYFDVLLNTVGTPYVTVSAGDGAAYRPIALSPFGGGVVIGGTTVLGNGALTVYQPAVSSMGYIVNQLAATYSDASPNAQLLFRSRFTGESVDWDTFRFKWGYAANYNVGGSRFALDMIDTSGNYVNAITVNGARRVGIGRTDPSYLLSLNDDLPLIELARSSTARGYFGISNSGGALVTGSAANDMGIRTQGGALLFSMDSGTTAHVVMRSSGSIVRIQGAPNPGSDGSSDGGQLQIATIGNRTAGVGGTIAFQNSSGTASTDPNWTMARIQGVAANGNNADAAGMLIFGVKDWYNPGGGTTWAWRDAVKIYSSGLLQAADGLWVSGREAADAILYMYADEGDDNVDQWRLRADVSSTFSLEGFAMSSTWIAAVQFYPHSGSGTFTVAMPGVLAQTTASAANVFVDAASQLLKSTSSSRYKTDIRDLPEKFGTSLMRNLRPVIFRSICDADRKDIDHMGFIAEEIHESGATPLLFYDEKNNPDGVQYDRITAVLVKAFQELDRRLTKLEAA